MPGIVVAVGGFSTDRLRAAVQKLVYLPSHHSEAVALCAELAIGWAGPRERIERQTWTGEPGHEVHVWRYGHTFKEAVQPSRSALRRFFETTCPKASKAATSTKAASSSS